MAADPGDRDRKILHPRPIKLPARIPFNGDFSAERQRSFLPARDYSGPRYGQSTDRHRAAPLHAGRLARRQSDHRAFRRQQFPLCSYCDVARIWPRSVRGRATAPTRFFAGRRARGATAHESQSLMVEMQASCSREFLSWLAPQLEQAFGGDPACWSVANVLNAYRRVNTGHIRIESDEISNPLHVILRYRIERALLSGDLMISDLPGAWSDLSHELLGRRPPSDTAGCLQDIHWAAGLFGYFRTTRSAQLSQRNCSKARFATTRRSCLISAMATSRHTAPRSRRKPMLARARCRDLGHFISTQPCRLTLIYH